MMWFFAFVNARQTASRSLSYDYMVSRAAFIGVIGSLVFLGAGCRSLPSSDPVLSASAEVTTNQLVFAPGDTFGIQQTFFGLGDLPSALWPAQELERTVTIDVYVPERHTEISWQAETEQETQTSLQARADYEKKIAGRKKGDEYPPPPTVHHEIVTARGKITGIDLQNSQTLGLPAYWTPGVIPMTDRSGVWLSQNVYRELARSTSTNVYFDLTSQAAGDLLRSTKEWVEAVARLRRQEVAASPREEPARLVREAEALEWPIAINGEERRVKAWRAKNGFGELVVLANEHNPLVLKATVNPALLGIGGAVQGKMDWNKLFGYEIKRLQVQALR